MHRQEYPIQMGFAMLTDKALIKPEKLTFHVAPDAGPDVTLGLLNTLYLNPQMRFSTMGQLCTTCVEQFGVATHHFDAAKMAQLAGVTTKIQHGKPIRLTERGLQIVTAATRLQVDLLHYLLYTGWDERQPTHNGPLCTYRQVCDILWHGGADRVSQRRLLRGVKFRLNELFNTVAEYQQLRLSLSGKSMRGVTIWLARLNPPAHADAQFVPRADCPSELLVLALAWVYRDRIPSGWSDGSLELILDFARREELARLCLLDPAALDHLLNLATDRHRRYLTDGGYGGGGLRILHLHRLPQLSDDTLLGRAAIRND